MNKIAFPLTPHMQGPTVADLQDALQQCLDRNAVLANDAGSRRDLAAALKRERATQTYGDATAKLLSAFQHERHLEATGAVDEATANALNVLLEEWGLLGHPTDPSTPVSFVVSGQVRHQDGSPVQQVRVRAMHDGATASSNAGSVRLGETAVDAQGRYSIPYELPAGMQGVDLHLIVLDVDGKPLTDSGIIHGAERKEIVDLIVPGAEATLYSIDGTVGSSTSAGVGGLHVVIVDKGVGGDVQLAQAVTDDSGAYQVTFPDSEVRSRGKVQPDVQARVFAGDTFLAASDVRYDAATRETLNVLLDDKAASALQPEFEVLTSALAGHVKGTLRDLKETTDQQDITYLANKTGWDARAVALAALADQFSAATADAAGSPAIAAPFFYALFRVGLAANEDTLYRTDAATLTGVWKNAAEQGVISKGSLDQVPKVVERFQALSAQKLLSGPALVGPASFKDMLTVSGLDEAQQQQFAELYTTHRTDTTKLWAAVNTSLGPDVTRRLRVDGKLAFLTINNASLMQKVHAAAGANGLSDPLQLAELGYYSAPAWTTLLAADVPIPQDIPGDTPEVRRSNYSEYLAAQVRLSYPTAAVAQMVKRGALPLTGTAPGVSDKVHAFLSEHQGKFEIGTQPLDQYIARNNVEADRETVTQVKRLQRVYQITPSDEAMVGLMKRGIDAAYTVVRYDKDTFVRSFAADVGGADPAARTYDRSVQVHSAVLNVAIGYLTARTALPIGVHSPPSILDPVPVNTSDVIATSTLERLFGSMDFCACDHCRSILSPAAYLVDLLLFLDADDQEWQDFCLNWHADHQGAPYPFPNPAAWTAAGQPHDTEISPLDVLLSRRPNIEHLPLTCENTNTALPYIDLVNETLEYFVANDVQKLSLQGYAGHDTNGSASEDLLATPQFVLDAAYTTLRDERFPLPLPFHQPLETARRYFNTCEVSLARAMERFRKSDDLDRGANPYGWRDILMEEVGLSRDEHEILTDSGAVPLWRMYGFPTGRADSDVIAGLSNFKQFARRLGVTYDDLISILRTRFINPYSDLIPKLERLGVSLATLGALKNGTITDQDFDLLLAALAVPPDPAMYGGDPSAPTDDYAPIRAWVKDNDNDAHIVGLITLAVPTAVWTASTAHAAAECVRPTAPLPGSTLYFECITPGTSAAAEPAWPVIPGKTLSDGTVEWGCRDASSCLGFDNLAFQYSDPAKHAQNIAAIDFVRLARFIRLWKKLGWTIGQTDAAMCALYRADMHPIDGDDVDTLAKLDAGFLTLLPRLGTVIRAMRALGLTTSRDLLPLLACWSEIGTHGDAAIYRQMFLNPTVLRQDEAFADNGYGQYLTKHTALGDHADALCAAFNLTGHEFNLIVAGLPLDASRVDRDPDNTVLLTLRNVSAIFRRGWLARTLKLSVRELLLLTRLTGLDPFAPPDPARPAMLRLANLVQSMKDRSVKTAAALYLLWNQDLSGKSKPDPAGVRSFARTLRLALAAVETEFAVADDPDGSIAQARMATVYGSDAATFFFGLLGDTLIVDVPFSDPDGTLAGAARPAIENAAGKTDALAPRIAYDDLRKRLSYAGELTAAGRDAIKLAAGAGAAAFNAAVDDLCVHGQAIVTPFFAHYPELRAPHDNYVADTTHPAAEKRSTLLNEILPELVQRRKRQQALQLVTASAATDLDFAQAFLDPPSAPLPLHAAGHDDQPALNDLLAVETAGLSVHFFANDTASGTVIAAPDVAANLDYAPATPGGSGNPLPTNPNAGAAISAAWSGCIEAPDSGFFNVRIEADAGATVTLTLDDAPVALTQQASHWVNSGSIELRAGALSPITVTVEKVRDVVRVEWEWAPKGQGRTVIPARYLYPATLVDRFRHAYVRFLKVASLATGLGMDAPELVFLATHPDYHIGGAGWLNALSVDGDPDAPTANALLEPFEAVLDFARIKADVAPTDDSLLTVLEDPATATRDADSVLPAITRWDLMSLNDVVAWFAVTLADLSHFDVFRRVYDAFALIQTMGISAKALIAATTNEPAADAVRGLQAALRARYDDATWRDVVRPINDQMRGLQRDALVAYILHQMRSNPASAHVDTVDKLFEYFLMDVQMDPCMQTSRIRHALSSIQLFIGRCLMNLEPRVSSAAINASQWEWMKRYRVWEANRKVYLFPENWLEPELRDDQSPFFRETMSELLQSDITDASATSAVLTYLSKLAEVAKLEPCGMFYIPADPAMRTGDISHVVARTAGAHRTYYYRRNEFGSWTAWEQVKLDIEDNPVLPIVWNDRLFIFWLRILKQGPGAVQKPFSTDTTLASLNTTDIKPTVPNMTVRAVLCWSEYFNGKWQAARTSDVATPLSIGDFKADDFDRSKLKLSALFWTQGALRVIVSYDTTFGASFFLHNAFSTPELRSTKKEVHFAPKRTLETTTSQLQITYTDPSATSLVLTNAIPNRGIQPNHPVDGESWDPPFFYGDARNVFYVTTSEELVWVWQADDYGVDRVPPTVRLDIPPLVFAPRIVIPDAAGPIIRQPGFGVVDPSPAQRYVTEDAYIQRAIGTSGTVRYGGVDVGVAGSQIKSVRTR